MKKYLTYINAIVEWCDRNQAWGWFIFIVVTLCVICSGGTSYAMYDLEHQYKADRELDTRREDSIVSKVDSLRDEVQVLDAKLDVILHFVEK